MAAILATMIENILDKFDKASLKTAGLALVGLFVVVTAVKWVNTELKIRALGGHTRKAHTWLPWGNYSHSVSDTMWLIFIHRL